jgi:16S rRNA G966 N2-methylase RsmD
MEKQKQLARASWTGSGEVGNDKIWFDLKQEFGGTEFLGYETLSVEAKVLAIVNKDDNEFDSLIKFANDKNGEYLNYIKKENNITNPKFHSVVSLFKKNLLRNFNKTKSFNFKIWFFGRS